MKVRLDSGVIIIFGITALIIFLVAPIMIADIHLEGTNAIGDYNYDQRLSLLFNGRGKQRNIGFIYGSYVDESILLSPDYFSVQGGDFPFITIYVTTIGIILGIIGGAILMVDLNSKWKVLGCALCVLGGLLGITGELILLSFNNWFIDYFTSYSYTTKYSIGFIFPIILNGLIILTSILLLFLKPIFVYDQQRDIIDEYIS